MDTLAGIGAGSRGFRSLAPTRSPETGHILQQWKRGKNGNPSLIAKISSHNRFTGRY